jgi:hypothetical protein
MNIDELVFKKVVAIGRIIDRAQLMLFARVKMHPAES